MQAAAITRLPEPVEPPGGAVITDSGSAPAPTGWPRVLAAFRERLRSDEPPRRQDLDHVGGRLVLFGGTLTGHRPLIAAAGSPTPRAARVRGPGAAVAGCPGG